MSSVGTSASEMARLIAEKDWSQTPVGAEAQWSPALRMSVSLLLANRFPLLLWWGRDYVQFYNDAYRPIPGEKHPKSLGQPARECWPEIWHILQPLIDRPFQGGPPTWIEDFELEVHRSSFREETHFTVAYSPVPDETVPNGIGGVLATVHEITEKVIGERRLALLRDLASRATEGRTAEDACAIAAETFTKYPKDLPFSAIYLFGSDSKTAHLVCTAGMERGQPASPLSISWSEGVHGVWNEFVRAAIGGNETIEVDNLGSRLSIVPPGPWSDPPRNAVVVPIPATKTGEVRGFFIHGVSARIALEENYRTFFQLIAAQLATAISNAEAYEQERQRAEALAEIDRAKTAFFSNVSHEFRTPLTLMLGPLQELLAENERDLPASAREQIEVASRNGARLLRLVNTLLDFSRIEAGRLQAVYQPTDLCAFTADLASVFRAATEKAGLRLVVSCQSLGEPVYVDHDMWEKVVLNLLSNAFKFTFVGEIAISVERCGDWAELRVRDTGVGIPEESLPKIFERFHRVPNTKSRTHEGTGIGLALVQELVKVHGGSIRVESTAGKGTTFIVSIPFGQKHLPANQVGGARLVSSPPASSNPFVEEALRWLPDASTAVGSEVIRDGEPAEPQQSGSAETGVRARILIADDNSDMRQYLAHLLRQKYEVETVGNGEAALKVARERPPDLILSDVMMPELNGFGLLKAIRQEERTRYIPIVLLSARAGEDSRLEGMQAAANDYLVKPFSAQELLARIGARLEISRLQREKVESMRSDLDAMTRLQEIGNVCTREGNDFQRCLEEIVGAAVELTKAEKGNMQLVDAASGTLKIVAQKGFDEPFLSFFGILKDKDSACGAALLKRGRVMVEDITKSDIFGEASLKSMLDEGVRAVQSTPLISSNGRLLGIISTHYSETHSLSQRELRLMDLLALQAADYLERKEAESQLRNIHSQLEQKVEERTRELLRASQELRELSARILQAQDEERRRLARELHDGVGQLVAALGMEMANLGDGGETVSGRTAVKSMEFLVAQLNQDIRTMSYLLYPPLLDEIGLRSALEEYVSGFGERSHIEVNLDVAANLGRLDRGLELCLFRVVQEALTNIHRHSESKTAAIRMRREASVLTLEICDDGKGIPAERLVEIQTHGSGVGIRGMRERVRHFGGEMSIESGSSGTRIFLTVPIPKASVREDRARLQTAV